MSCLVSAAWSRSSSTSASVRACRPYHWKDSFPLVSTISPALKARVLADWAGRLDFLSEEAR